MKNKKILIAILFGVVIISGLIIAIVVKSTDNKKRTIFIGVSDWEVVSGKSFDRNNVDNYVIGEYEESTFNGMNSQSKMLYNYILPKNVFIESINANETVYRIDELTVGYSASYLDEDINKYIKGFSIESKDFYDKVYTRKKVIGDNYIVLDFQLLDDSNSYREELYLFSLDDENLYTELSYKVEDKKFSEGFIDLVVENFTWERDKANYNICKQDNNRLLCTYNHIKDINIELVLDNNKYYNMTYGVMNKYITTFGLTTEGEDYDLVNSIDFYLLHEENEEELERIRGSLETYEERMVTINNKKFYRYFDSEGYSIIYLYEVNEDTVIYISLESDEQEEEIINDFSNFELKG